MTKSEFLRIATTYLNYGLSVIPLQTNSKQPACPWATYQQRKPTIEELRELLKDDQDYGIAIVCGEVSGIVVLDIDNLDKFMSTYYKPPKVFPDTLFVRTRKGWHVYFRYPNGKDVRRVDRIEQWGCELRGNGCYVVAPPTIIDGHQYTWKNRDGELSEFAPDKLAECPDWLLNDFEVGEKKAIERKKPEKIEPPEKIELPPWAKAVVELLKPYWKEKYRHNLALSLAGVFAVRGVEKEIADAIITELTKDTNDDELKDRLRAVFDTYTLWEGGNEVKAWKGLKELQLPENLIDTLRKLIPSNHSSNDTQITSVERPQHQTTDEANAERLVKHFGKFIRWVDKWGWLVWDGKKWVRDPENVRIMRLAQETVKLIYKEAAECDDENERKSIAKWAIASESRYRISAMIDLARPKVLAEPHEFDADDWLLNCANGVLNLKTGEFMPHKPEFKLTKITQVTYDPNADCQKWKEFLNRIFNGNERLIRFVQRAVGYSLTGSTREQCIFFLYGTGANGKSTFLEVIRALLGDYAVTADFNTFSSDHKNGIPNDIARLHGARLVTAIEVGEGKRFAEERIKILTGNDTVTARFLYREYFEFRPRFKLWIAANYKPEIRGTDYAIWRRIRLIPFTVTIPPEEQIPDLADQLKEELSGILNWALEGLRDWLVNGLQPPPEVTEATEAYREEMDIVGQFIRDMCELDPKAVTPAKELYEKFQEWCNENGYYPFTQQNFGRRLSTLGLRDTRMRLNGKLCRCWCGIRLKGDKDSQPDLIPPEPPTEPVTDVTDVTDFSKKFPSTIAPDQFSEKSVTSVTSVTPVTTPPLEQQQTANEREEGYVDTEEWLEELVAEFGQSGEKMPQNLPKCPECGAILSSDPFGVTACSSCKQVFEWLEGSWVRVWRPESGRSGDFG
jgi:putative DNA primase/helicase